VVCLWLGLVLWLGRYRGRRGGGFSGRRSLGFFGTVIHGFVASLSQDGKFIADIIPGIRIRIRHVRMFHVSQGSKLILAMRQVLFLRLGRRKS
jgi:hypothetical protein